MSFLESENNYIKLKHFSMTVVFLSLLMYGQSQNTFMHNTSNMWNKQMEINTCKI